ncbi:MAG: RNA-binding protein [Flavobacteriia bacterium]|nr:RNA-binding protein [Flavobacteriia bacterium]
MMQLGEIHRFTLMRFTPQGAYVQGKVDEHLDEEEVLYPKKYLNENAQEGDEVRAFLMKDSVNRRVAVGEVPKLTLDACAFLSVTEMNMHGAFADWGLDKDLFIPFSEQREGIDIGEAYPVMLCYDAATDRLFGSMKINKKLLPAQPEQVNRGVRFLVTEHHELGWRGIADQKYLGMLYRNECKIPIELGQTLEVYVSAVRPDGKMDLKISSTQPQKYDEATEQIMTYFQEHKFLFLTDKSDASAIYSQFQMSKKTFKQAIGKLYKQRKIKLFNDKIARMDE